MSRRVAFRALTIAGAIGAVMATAAPVEANGRHHHGHSHFAFGLNFGVPCCYVGPRTYYYPPPVYYYAPPPPVVYTPAPVYYAPPPPRVGNCRDYHGDATIDGQGTPFYGRACLGSDGRWHIVSRY